MKTMKKFLSMAALALVGAMTVGCTNEDNVIDQAQTATKSNVVTQTVTVGFDEQAATRALAIDYTNHKLTKTFKANDQIAVIYQDTNDDLVKKTVTITDADITAEGKSAKFTVSMTDPKENGTLKYIYPAAMAGETDVDYTKLNTQDGTLASLAANLDLAVYDGNLTAAKELPASASLTNKLAILALTFKNSEGTSPLTGINKMTLSDGTNIYTITGKDTDGHIYAAIQPTTAFSCIATDGTNNYAKSLTGKNYAANNIYNLGLKMKTAPSVIEVTTFSELQAALSAGKDVKLMNDIVCTAQINITSGALTIDGNGKTLSTTSEIRAFKVGFSATVAFKDLTLTGFVSGGGPAINNSGTIVLDGCTISNCHVNNSNGGGAIESSGKLYAINTTFSGNYSGEIGGAINNYGGSLYMSRCTFTNNYTTDSNAFYGGAIGINGGNEVRLINCAFSGNKYGSGTTTGTSNIGVFNNLTTPTNYTIAGCTGVTIASRVAGDITTNASGTATLDYSDLSNISFTYTAEGGAYTLLSAATTSDYGKVVCAAGHLHDAKTAVPTGCTAVGILGKVSSTGHGLILALHDATAQTWKTISGWTSTPTYASTTLRALPDDAARGANLTSYTALGETAVSNWAVAQKSDYEAIFTNLGSTKSDTYGTTYDNNVNAYITTGVGGTELSLGYFSATEHTEGWNAAWAFTSDYWQSQMQTVSYSVRPVLGF